MDVTIFGRRYDVTEKTITGQRDENQDCCLWAFRNSSEILLNHNGALTRETNHHRELFVAAVCDGMGGMGNGSAASSTLASALLNWAKEAEYKTVEEYCISLKKTIASAEDVINRDFPGSGTTVSLILCMDSQWYSFHIGDSRCYLVAKERFFRTVDQSPVEDLFQNGIIEEEAMIHHPMKNVISYYVGGNHAERLVRDDLGSDWDSLTVCSDGAFGYMPVVEFRELISGSSDAGSIVDAALEKGSKDNISAIRIIRS